MAVRVWSGAGENGQVIADIRYDEAADALFDIYPALSPRPADATIVWLHGGGWIGGSKDELVRYFEVLAAEGFNVVAVNYTLAPIAHYPTPVRQVFQALNYLAERGQQWGVDNRKIVLAGDSAGANIAAQAALAATNDQYAAKLGMPALAPDIDVVATVLQCGVYDAAMMASAKGSFAAAVREMLVTYTDDPYWAEPSSLFAAQSVLPNVTQQFPATFISSGNNDDLTPQSKALAQRLRQLGVLTSELFFARSARPRTGHEYQFELHTEPAQRNLEQMVDFIRQGRLERH